MKYSSRITDITVFSASQVELMLTALGPLNVYLDCVGDLPNVTLAKDTMLLLHGKLQEMIRAKNYMAVFGLDSNEVLMLHAALMAFCYGISTITKSQEKKLMQGDCQMLVAHFGAMLTCRSGARVQPLA